MVLSVLVWIPVLAAIAIVALPAARARAVAMTTAWGLLVWSAILTAQFDPTQLATTFDEAIPWLQELGLSYRLELDGLSLPMVVLNAALTLVAVCCSSRTISRPRFYYSMLLVLSGAAAGTFLAGDLLLFFLFYEIELVPLYFLIAIWGGERRTYAATKFLLYTATSGILILAAFLGLVLISEAGSFAYDTTLAQSLPLGTQTLLLAILVVGFGVKIPIFPFHTWLPDAHVEASTPISVLLAGVLLKLGTYGLLRFGVGLFPEAWGTLAPAMAAWAAVSALFGALAAISQQDMKKMVAYSSIAHMAYILLAAAAATPLSLVAAVAQMVSHGIISALLFLVVGIVGKKAGTRDITVLQGLLNPQRGLPIVGSLTILGAMASAGIPGMVGFISEFLVFRGSFAAFPIPTLVCLVGTGLTAVYFLLAINRVFFGRLSPTLMELPHVAWNDRIPAIALAVLAIVFGIQPSWLLRWSEVETAALAGPIVRQETAATDVPHIGLAGSAPVELR